MIKYKNISNALGIVISAEPPMATLYELETIYSVEDVYVMLEIISVNNHNRRMIQKHHEQQQQPI